VLRIEDLDGPRVKAGLDRQLIDDLEFLGLDWDEGPVYQTTRTALYQSAIDDLVKKKRAYACICTRREVDLAASAPHAEDGSAIYPGTCRGRFASMEEARAVSGRSPAIRFAAPDETVVFEDGFAGQQKLNVARQLGDFVIAKSDGVAAYQLAVVVDDVEGGITHVVRGDDLLESTFRQILLYRALGREDRLPRYVHLPLVVGADGRRLAKRHGDTRLATYREKGVPRGRFIELLARWCGMDVAGRGVDHPRQLLEGFNLRTIPQSPIVFTSEDDAWLCGRS
jgi:glutamyl-tRNA synthetase